MICSRRSFLQQITLGTLTAPFLLNLLKKQLRAENKITKIPLIWIQGHSSNIHQSELWNNTEFFRWMKKYTQIINWDTFKWDQNTVDLKDNEQPIILLEGIFSKNSNFEFNLTNLHELLSKAKAIILLGTETCYVKQNQQGIFQTNQHLNLITDLLLSLNVPYFCLPGIPVPIRHLLGTLNYLYLYGPPEIDEYRRPLMFYSKLVCDYCEYRKDFENGNFVNFYGEKKGCLYLLGCKGPITKNTCAVEHWEHTSNWCVRAGSPCIGCSNPEFPNHSGLGLFGQLEGDPQNIPGVFMRNVKNLGKGIVGLTVAGLATHAISKKAPLTLESQELDKFYSEFNDIQKENDR